MKGIQMRPNNTTKVKRMRAVKDSGLKPDSSTTAVTDPPAVLGNPGNPDGSDPSAPAKDAQPTKAIPSKGKGPNSESSSKAPALQVRRHHPAIGCSSRGSGACMQSTLFTAATLAQATGTEEDMV